MWLAVAGILAPLLALEVRIYGTRGTRMWERFYVRGRDVEDARMRLCLSEKKISSETH